MAWMSYSRIPAPNESAIGNFFMTNLGRVTLGTLGISPYLDPGGRLTRYRKMASIHNCKLLNETNISLKLVYPCTITSEYITMVLFKIRPVNLVSVWYLLYFVLDYLSLLILKTN